MLADFSIAPVDKGGGNLSEYVAKVLEIVNDSGLEHQTHAMGTLIEGDTEDVFDLIKKCHMRMLEYSDRVYTVIKIDDRKHSKGRLKGKVESVKKHLK